MTTQTVAHPPLADARGTFSRKREKARAPPHLASIGEVRILLKEGFEAEEAEKDDKPGRFGF